MAIDHLEAPLDIEDLVLSHIDLAHAIAHRYRYRSDDPDDLEQVACLALIRAASRFDPHRGTTFATFARSSIIGELKHYFRDNWPVRVGRSRQTAYLTVRDACERAIAVLGRQPTIEELCGLTGLSRNKVQQAYNVRSALAPKSLEAGDSAGLADDRSADSAIDRFESMIDDLAIDQILSGLSPCEQEIAMLRFRDGLSQTAIAQRLSMSQMRVSRTLTRMLQTIRRRLDE